MKLLRIKAFAILCIFTVLLMPCCVAVNSDIKIEKYQKNDLSEKFNEIIDALNSGNVSKVWLMLKLARISLVTLVLYLVTDKALKGNLGMSITVDIFLSLIYSMRVNRITRQYFESN
jgi:hypothetical protein